MASHAVHGKRGGVALIMLIGFIVLAVPVTIASIQTGGQLSRNSRVYDTRLTGMYNSGSAVEVALHKILSDPNFDVGLTPGSPSKAMTADANGETVNITVTKIFPSGLQGQGLVLSKVVTPTSTPASVPTTFTYTITLKNEGQDTITLEQVRDYLPPGLSYATSSTSGLTTAEPGVAYGTIDTDYWYLNSGNGPPPTPWTWETSPGSNQSTASSTPAVSTWEEVPDSWESDAFATDGLIPATTWSHRQRIKRPTGGGSNLWRWKVQRVRGAVVTDLFTSASGTASSSWSYRTISHSAPGIPMQAGDKLRLRLEVWAPSADPALRLMEYRWGGASGYQSRTTIPKLFVGDCNDGAAELTWDLSPFVQVDMGEELTLTFQASDNGGGGLANGTYYNQASARYDPWWVSSDVTSWTPYTAQVTVGTGSPKCGYDMDILVTKDVQPQEADPGVATEFTYTVTVENTDAATRYICMIEDLLPPGHTYVAGSAADYPANIKTSEPSLSWRSTPQRWRLRWGSPGSSENPPIATLAAGETRTQVFRASATLEAGVNYFNEVSSDFARFLDEGECDVEDPGDGGTSQGGAGNSSKAVAPPLYDIQAVGADGTVLSRALFRQSQGQIEILSWQEY